MSFERTSWCIRTVYDVSADKVAGGRFSTQVRLLAATWRYWVKDVAETPLEIVCVGGEPPENISTLASLGVRLSASPRPPASAVGGTANKLAGLLVSDDRVPALLVDNDCAFTGPIRLPPGAEHAALMAAMAGIDEVAPAQWEAIADAFGAKPRHHEWVPLVEECSALAGRRSARKSINLYLNSGVVFAAKPRTFGTQWDRWITRIAGLFERHPLQSDVYKNDQVGLAIVAGEVDAFTIMSTEWNYRPPCFWLARAEAQSIHIVHMTGMHLIPEFTPLRVRKMVNRFWEERVLKLLNVAGEPTMGSRARDIAVKIRNVLLDSVATCLPEEMP